MTYEELVQELITEASKSPSHKRKVGALIIIPRTPWADNNDYDIIGRGHNYRLSPGPCENEDAITHGDVIHAEATAIRDMQTRMWNAPSYSKMLITHEPCTGCQAFLKAERLPYIVIKKGLNMTEETNVNNTLKERGSVYGTFINNANLTQNLMGMIEMGAEHADRKLNNFELEALHMICHKISRIVCGKKPKKDNWHDIAGYATLAEELTIDQ